MWRRGKEMGWLVFLKWSGRKRLRAVGIHGAGGEVTGNLYRSRIGSVIPPLWCKQGEGRSSADSQSGTTGWLHFFAEEAQRARREEFRWKKDTFRT